MKWYKNLYVGESIAHKTKRVKWKILHNGGQIDVYVIALASNPENLLDVIPSWELMQKYYPKKNIFVVGLAKGYDEAMGIVQQMIEEVYLQTGTVDIRKKILESVRKEKQ